MKQFTENHAVDVRGMSETMFKTIQRVAGPEMGGVYYSDIDVEYNYLTVIGKSYNLASIKCVRDLELKHLTPTDILGEHLVEAIEEGYTPIFDEDPMVDGIFDIALADGYIMREVDTSRSWGASSKAIAYKPSQASIESKILAEKVNFNLKPIEGTTISNHEFHDMMEAHSRLHHICNSGNLTINQDELYSEFLSFLRGNK